MRPQYRQGDVFLVKIERLPEEAKEQNVSDQIVLAYGEATGHSHSVSKKNARLFNAGDQNYLVVDAEAKVVHEEHSPIELKNGVYKVVRQREYEPVNGMEFVSD